MKTFVSNWDAIHTTVAGMMGAAQAAAAPAQAPSAPTPVGAPAPAAAASEEDEEDDDDGNGGSKALTKNLEELKDAALVKFDSLRINAFRLLPAARPT